MSAWVKPGVKCVCVQEPSAEAKASWPEAKWPVLNSIYTIRSAPLITHGPRKGGLCILVEEIINPVIPELGTAEPGFPAFAFSPLVSPTQEQDLEHFLPLLDLKELVE